MRWSCDAGRRGARATVVRQRALRVGRSSASSRNGSASATTRLQAAHISSSGGVDAGCAGRDAGRGSARRVRPWPRSNQISRSCQARWPIIHEIEFIGSSRRRASSSVRPTQPALPFGSGEPELVDTRMGHGRSVAASDVPSRPARECPTLSSPTDLPSHVQRHRRRDRDRDRRGAAAAADRSSRAPAPRTTARTAGSRPPSARSCSRSARTPTARAWSGRRSRVHRMYTELTAGYHVDPERLINGAIFDVAYSEMVVVKDIPFYSLCEHHLLPFFGTAAVAYIPRGRVIGLSKIPRIVEMYARRLQVQERLTQQVAEFLQDRLEPQGVGVVIEATHLCAVMRGVRKPGHDHDHLVGARAVPDPRPDPGRVLRPPRAARAGGCVDLGCAIGSSGPVLRPSERRSGTLRRAIPPDGRSSALRATGRGPSVGRHRSTARPLRRTSSCRYMVERSRPSRDGRHGRRHIGVHSERFAEIGDGRGASTTSGATFRTCRAVARDAGARAGAAIVNIAPVRPAWPGDALRRAKAGIVELTASLAKELGRPDPRQRRRADDLRRSIVDPRRPSERPSDPAQRPRPTTGPSCGGSGRTYVRRDDLADRRRPALRRRQPALDDRRSSSMPPTISRRSGRRRRPSRATRDVVAALSRRTSGRRTRRCPTPP